MNDTEKTPSKAAIAGSCENGRNFPFRALPRIEPIANDALTVKNHFDMLPLLTELVRRVRAGECVAMCTIVATRGSTPQEKGARMLVTLDGRTFGTLGGGCVEAEVRRHAIQIIQSGVSQLKEFHLDRDYGWDDGLICGGAMDVFIESLSVDRVEHYANALDALREQRSIHLKIQYEQSGEQREFVQEISPGATLVIAGAGHVAQALARIAGGLDFRVTVIDDRPDFASEARFPNAENRIVGSIEDELRKFDFDANSFVVIVTRGHQRDGIALHAVIDSPAKYIGLIGSKRKIKAIFDDLHAQGVSSEKLARVHAPIGLDIGAITVDEIAVSIAAELIAVRRGRLGAATPMKISADELDRWLTRPAPASPKVPDQGSETQ